MSTADVAMIKELEEEVEEEEDFSMEMDLPPSFGFVPKSSLAGAFASQLAELPTSTRRPVAFELEAEPMQELQPVIAATSALPISGFVPDHMLDWSIVIDRSDDSEDEDQNTHSPTLVRPPTVRPDVNSTPPVEITEDTQHRLAEKQREIIKLAEMIKRIEVRKKIAAKKAKLVMAEAVTAGDDASGLIASDVEVVRPAVTATLNEARAEVQLLQQERDAILKEAGIAPLPTIVRLEDDGGDSAAETEPPTISITQESKIDHQFSSSPELQPPSTTVLPVTTLPNVAPSETTEPLAVAETALPDSALSGIDRPEPPAEDAMAVDVPGPTLARIDLPSTLAVDSVQQPPMELDQPSVSHARNCKRGMFGLLTS